MEGLGILHELNVKKILVEGFRKHLWELNFVKIPKDQWKIPITWILSESHFPLVLMDAWLDHHNFLTVDNVKTTKHYTIIGMLTLVVQV